MVAIDNRILSSNQNSSTDKPAGHAFQLWDGWMLLAIRMGEEKEQMEKEENEDDLKTDSVAWIELAGIRCIRSAFTDFVA